MPPKFQLILLVRDEATNSHVRFDLRRPELIEAVREELLRDLPKSVSKGTWHAGGYVRIDEAHAWHLLMDEPAAEAVKVSEPSSEAVKVGDDYDGEPQSVAG